MCVVRAKVCEIDSLKEFEVKVCESYPIEERFQLLSCVCAVDMAAVIDYERCSGEIPVNRIDDLDDENHSNDDADAY